MRLKRAKLAMCHTCGGIVPKGFEQRHVDFHAVQASAMQAIKIIQERLRFEFTTNVSVDIDFEEIEIR